MKNKDERRILILRVVYALFWCEVGLLVAVVNVRLLAMAPEPWHSHLLALKTVFSDLIGNARGWTEHVKEHDAVGLWLQLAFLVAIVAILGIATTWAMERRRHWRGWGLWPAAAGVVAPWLVLLLAAEFTPTEGGAMSIALLIIAALGAWLLRLSQERQRPKLLLGLVPLFVLWYVLLDRYATASAEPLVLLSGIVGLLLVATGLKPSVQIQQAVGQPKIT